MKRPALVPATKGLTLPVGGSGPATSRDTTVPLSAGVTDVHVAPPSLLIKTRDPRVPASTRPGVNGSKTMVVMAARPACTEVHVEPPLVDLKSEPCTFPEISA